MARLQLTALAGGADDEMEEVALLGSYDVEAGVAAGDDDAGMRRVQVRVAGMTCSACTGAVEAALSGRRGVRRAAVSLLQNRADVVFDPALAKVRRLAGPVISPPRSSVSVAAPARVPFLLISSGCSFELSGFLALCSGAGN
jgi:Cu+-exporting ATPase